MTELAELRRWWNYTRPHPAMLWGRRRVGKTALLAEFATAKPAIFHTGTGQSAAGELADLSSKTGELRHRALRNLTERPYRDWQEALKVLGILAEDEPLLVVLHAA